jgi:catechol 2,3-dioxygenase-like lactoylglutathione lyase family enzyme
MNAGSEGSFPVLRQVVLDTTDARRLADFYRQLLGFSYRAGDEPPSAGEADEKGGDWLVLCDRDGAARIAFQQVSFLVPPTWPRDGVPQQLHLDMVVSSVAELDAQHERALGLGARLLEDRSADEMEPLRVYADPAGHPFCIFVVPSPTVS